MYDSQLLVDRIRKMASSRGIGIVKLHEMCGLSRNVISQTANRKRGLTAENLYAVASALECSTDYLLGLSSDMHAQKSVVQQNNNVAQNFDDVAMPLMLTDSPQVSLDENQRELLKRFGMLEYAEKIKFMQELINKTEGIE